MTVVKALGIVAEKVKNPMRRYIEYDDCYIFSILPVGTKSYGEGWFAVDKNTGRLYMSEPRPQENIDFPIGEY